MPSMESSLTMYVYTAATAVVLVCTACVLCIDNRAVVQLTNGQRTTQRFQMTGTNYSYLNLCILSLQY
jgi:hypothetical protein